LKVDAWAVLPLYEEFYCARGERENCIKEAQRDLFAVRIAGDHVRTDELRPIQQLTQPWAGRWKIGEFEGLH
jgi:hypothetical protein